MKSTFTRNIILGLIALRALIQLPFLNQYGFHRDEFLYIAQGNYPAWGNWSNPPLMGWVSWFTQNVFGDSIWAIRAIPFLIGCLLIALIVVMCKELGGGRMAQLLCGLGALGMMPYLRLGNMFQPVGMDVAIWTGLSYLLIKYINTENEKILLYFGIVLGIGLLNKLSLLFFLIAFLPVLALSPYRTVYRKQKFWLGVLLCFLLVLPYILWQFANDLPIFTHFRELQNNQLANVNIVNFLLDQVLMHLPAILLWPLGLWLLLKNKKYAILSWYFIAVLLVFILFKGKSYYTLGAFPVLISAGAIWWEQNTPRWSHYIQMLVVLLLAGMLFPFSLPVLPTEKMVEYCEEKAAQGIDGPMRWEDGQIHPLPQDYADMLGWEEFAPLVSKAVEKLPANSDYFLYAENYGQAGAIDYYGKKIGLNKCISFADSYRLWAPANTSAQCLIYVNDELGEDVATFFKDIQMIGKIENEFARENGTMVYLCQQPVAPFNEFWAPRYKTVLNR